MIAWVLAACVGNGTPTEAAPPPVWNAPKWTQSGKYEVALSLSTDPPPLGELFTVSARVRDKDGTAIEDGTVTLDARMPQHNHGMETDPIDDPGQCDPAGGRCKHPDGVYQATGFKFHMGGEWTITVDVVGPRGPDSTSFVYTLR